MYSDALIREVAWSWKRFGPGFGATGLPPSYLAIDTETTGLSGDDIALQFGWVLVKDGVEVDRASFYVDWWNHPPKNRDPNAFRPWLRERIAAVSCIFDQKGLAFPATLEKITTEGVAPHSVYKTFYDLVAQMQEVGVPLAGHTIISFDLDRISKTAQLYLDMPALRPNPNLVFDIAGADAAFRLAEAGDVKWRFPDAQSASDYFAKMPRLSTGGRRVGRKQAELAYACDIDAMQVHEALADAQQASQIIEFWRGKLGEVANSFADPVDVDGPVPETLPRLAEENHIAYETGKPIPVGPLVPKSRVVKRPEEVQDPFQQPPQHAGLPTAPAPLGVSRRGVRRV